MPAGPVGPVGPAPVPIGGPTHSPCSLITSIPPTLIVCGVMSPTTFSATSENGTLRIGCLGVISESMSMVMPR
jgi:hypothetical protein